MKRGETCVEDYCEAAVLARGMCSRHYNRWWRNSDQRRALRQRGYGVVGCGLCGKPLSGHSLVMGCPK